MRRQICKLGFGFFLLLLGVLFVVYFGASAIRASVIILLPAISLIVSALLCPNGIGGICSSDGTWGTITTSDFCCSVTQPDAAAQPEQIVVINPSLHATGNQIHDVVAVEVNLLADAASDKNLQTMLQYFRVINSGNTILARDYIENNYSDDFEGYNTYSKSSYGKCNLSSMFSRRWSEGWKMKNFKVTSVTPAQATYELDDTYGPTSTWRWRVTSTFNSSGKIRESRWVRIEMLP